jgi:hypothetical protein
VLYCCVFAQVQVELARRESCVKLRFLNLLLAWSVYNSRLGSYIETRGPIGGPEVVETLYNI